MFANQIEKRNKSIYGHEPFRVQGGCSSLDFGRHKVGRSSVNSRHNSQQQRTLGMCEASRTERFHPCSAWTL